MLTITSIVVIIDSLVSTIQKFLLREGLENSSGDLVSSL